MSEDVVDFGPTGRPDPAPASRRVRPTWMFNTTAGGMSLPLAAIGAALGAASLVGEWQSVQIANDGPQGLSFTSPVSGVGPLGTAYLFTVIVLVTVAALALFAEERVRKAARVAGLALSGTGLALLGATASTLTRTTGDIGMFRYYPADELKDVALGLEWGLYAGMGALLAIGAALLLNRPPLPSSAEPALDDEPEFEDAAIDLTVTVEPIRRRT